MEDATPHTAQPTARYRDATPHTAQPTARYRVKRGALVIISAACHQLQEADAWVADPGEAQAIHEFREHAEERGFNLLMELSEQPTAAAIRSFVDKLANTDFTSYDALLFVIASHGREGQLFGWPDVREDGQLESAPSGPIDLREEVFDQFCVKAQHGQEHSTTASRTLVGKPKVFLVDACRKAPAIMREPLPDEGQGGVVVGPCPEMVRSRPPLVPPDQLSSPDAEYVPLVGPDGSTTTRWSDFLFAYATMPFNLAGLNDGSLFLTTLTRQLRDHPASSFQDLLSATNGEMARLYAHEGIVGQSCFPQCAEVVTTLNR